MTATTLTAPSAVRDRFEAGRAAWRSVLVHVQPETEAQPRLRAAADLARKLDATLVGIAAEMVPPEAISDPYGLMPGGFVEAISEAIQFNLRAAHAAFESATAGLDRQWMALQDRPGDSVERLARCADLIVTGGCPLSDHDTCRWADPAELVIKAGRPVLVAPPSGGALSAASVVVAWKDSRESRRALADALPLLAGAERVTVVETTTESDIEALEAHHDSLLRHLLRHGVTAQSRILPAKSNETAAVLQEQRRALGSDLIVAGAYGRTRFGEWMFGGVTADLLADPQSFVLFSH